MHHTPACSDASPLDTFQGFKVAKWKASYLFVTIHYAWSHSALALFYSSEPVSKCDEAGSRARPRNGARREALGQGRGSTSPSPDVGRVRSHFNTRVSRGPTGSESRHVTWLVFSVFGNKSMGLFRADSADFFCFLLWLDYIQTTGWGWEGSDRSPSPSASVSSSEDPIALRPKYIVVRDLSINIF